MSHKHCFSGDQCIHPDGPWLPATTDFFWTHKQKADGLHPRCRFCSGTPLPAPTGYKRCPGCKELKPAAPEYFHIARAHSDGFVSRCKTCNCKTLVRRAVVIGDQKRCTQCLQWFQNTATHYPTKKPRCRECLKQELQKWREANKDHIAQYQREQRVNQTEEQREHVRELSRANRQRNRQYILQRERIWRAAHPEVWQRYRLANSERLKIAIRQWRQKNRHLCRLTDSRRRARERALPDTLTIDQWADCLDYWQHRCAICGRPPGLWHTIAQDHWIPLTDPRCPGTVACNIIPLCHGQNGCNNSKGMKEPHMWLERRTGKRKARAKIREIEAYLAGV